MAYLPCVTRKDAHRIVIVWAVTLAVLLFLTMFPMGPKGAPLLGF
jgi:hypothetical protein